MRNYILGALAIAVVSFFNPVLGLALGSAALLSLLNIDLGILAAVMSLIVFTAPGSIVGIVAATCVLVLAGTVVCAISVAVVTAALRSDGKQSFRSYLKDAA